MNQKVLVDYSSVLVPLDYVCSKCGATNCKLWWNKKHGLLCADHAAINCEEDIRDIDEKGTRSSYMGGRTNEIGWFEPAVPKEDGIGYCNYISIPSAGLKWWENLPTKP